MTIAKNNVVRVRRPAQVQEVLSPIEKEIRVEKPSASENPIRELTKDGESSGTWRIRGA